MGDPPLLALTSVWRHVCCGVVFMSFFGNLASLRSFLVAGRGLLSRAVAVPLALLNFTRLSAFGYPHVCVECGFFGWYFGLLLFLLPLLADVP